VGKLEEIGEKAEGRGVSVKIVIETEVYGITVILRLCNFDSVSITFLQANFCFQFSSTFLHKP